MNTHGARAGAPTAIAASFFRKLRDAAVTRAYSAAPAALSWAIWVALAPLRGGKGGLDHYFTPGVGQFG